MTCPYKLTDYFNDPILLNLSVSHPIQYKFDKVYGIQWQYRCGGNQNDPEAVVFLPGTYETCSSSIYILDKLIKQGYRAFALDLGEYMKYKQLAKGFDQFCAQLNIKKAHLIGSDLGGFYALQIASYPKLETQIKSITLINAFTSTDVYNKPGFVIEILGDLGAKPILHSEIKKLYPKENPSPTAVFIDNELDKAIAEILKARIKIRKATNLQINPRCELAAIMSIETLDKRFVFQEKFLPSIAIEGCKQALMKDGGDWPHIQNPDDTFHYITAHLRKWGKIPNLETIQDGTDERHED
ncbi:hypothetical protein TVAG_035010 [Trichomonas vaginalis G3]|uniref:Maspardin n=1 Tax=Trichomonas vaginalis (strain ATCC PRA-98 / G3) TaxID=412133 RepID=A2DAH5_TRIV3|nr:acid cluster protein 33 family [Trichomonas vaginalis G3]EAY22478.1 hypothetical protein TVAG_035010 [Trichomonas vaginalis G3]KAI5497201.1 acid cluster protein 33 family [Trichomonas vaginalis G3]|eukprot:XP_001583464.1 hypothetical protein [Trichomonas vaginalis G3]